MLTDLDYDLLSAYIDDALTESERASLESRLQTEPELRAELAELRATVTLLNNLPVLKAPRNFTLDARYARRSSFFTSVAFSALSSAAAIILFALGAYLFSLPSAVRSPGNVGQAAQVAAAPSMTPSTLDKSSEQTPTGSSLFALGTPGTDDGVGTGGETESADAANTTGLADALPLTTPTENADFSLFQAAPQQETTVSADTEAFSSAPAASEMQERSTDATATVLAGILPTEPDAMTGGAPAAPASDAAGAAIVVEPTLAAAAPLPAATFAPTMRPLPTATVLSTQPPSETPPPTATWTPLPTMTSTPTLEPLLPPPAAAVALDLPTLLVGLGVVFFILAVVTTLLRRSRR